MRTVTLEEHYASPSFLDGPGRELKAQALKFGAAAAKLFEQLCDVGEKRIAEMDAAKIDMQVLSLTSPGTEQLEAADAMELAREENDFLADAIMEQPTRFAGFARLPANSPYHPSLERGSKRKRRGFPIRSFRKSLWDGFIRKLDSSGITAQGTCRTGESPCASYSSPIACVALVVGYARQLFGSRDSSMETIRCSSIVAGIIQVG